MITEVELQSHIELLICRLPIPVGYFENINDFAALRYTRRVGFVHSYSNIKGNILGVTVYFIRHVIGGGKSL